MGKFLLSKDRVHLSSRGSYFNLEVSGGIFLKNITVYPKAPQLFEIMVSDSEAVLVNEEGVFIGENLKCAFYDKYHIVFKGNKKVVLNYDVTTGYKAYTAVDENGLIRISDTRTHYFYWFKAVKGEIRLNSKRPEGIMGCTEISVELIPFDNEFEVILYATEEIGKVTVECPSFDDIVELKKKDFVDFCKKTEMITDFEKEMAFSVWCNMVYPYGNYKEETVLCAKTTMNAVWSWDNAFNALCIAKAFPEIAFYNMLLPFYYMDNEGAMPDIIKTHAIDRIFTKPPVHSFIYDIMEEINPYFQSKETIERFYPYLSKNLDWWVNGRGEMPCYWLGNDSGADNSTCFDRYPVVSSPDLYALISFTAKKLSEFAETLGISDDMKKYKELADFYGKKVESDFFDGEKFYVIPHDFKGSYYSEGLLPLRALVAGEYLSKECVAKSAERLERDFLGNWGLTSESFKSEKRIEGNYESYWRGSVWGPEQIIIAHSLKKLGYIELSKKIINNYCNALEKSGAGETHNSLTGEQNCAKAYSWSASVKFYDVLFK